jgi:cytochrome c oxidase assembly protein subunit 11
MLGSIFRRAQLAQRCFQSTKETISNVPKYCGHQSSHSASIRCHRGLFTAPGTAVPLNVRQSELAYRASKLCIPRFFSIKSPEHIREQSRHNEQKKQRQRQQNQQVAWYMGGLTLFTISFTYASVPLYRMFCQKTGFAGTVKKDDVKYEQRAKPVSGKRLLTIKFNADVADALQWKFTPQQHEIKVVPGEAALAFYSATNNTDEPIIGVASYNVQPEQAGQYFNKIQCFCFEEQVRLRSKHRHE